MAPTKWATRLPALSGAAFGLGGALFGALVAVALFVMVGDTPGLRRLRASSYEAGLRRYVGEGIAAAVVLILVAFFASVLMPNQSHGSDESRWLFGLLVALSTWALLAALRLVSLGWSLWPEARRRDQQSIK